MTLAHLDRMHLSAGTSDGRTQFSQTEVVLAFGHVSVAVRSAASYFNRAGNLPNRTEITSTSHD